VTFQYKRLQLVQYRCFEALDLTLDPALTLLFAENGSGKSSILHALATGLTPFQNATPRGLNIDPRRDVRKIRTDERGRREPAGPCRVTWTADVGGDGGAEVTWSSEAIAASGRRIHAHAPVLDAIERVRVPGARWPLFAYYGVERMARGRASNQPADHSPDRWEGYAGSLDDGQDDSALLTWLLEEVLADTVRRDQGEPERFLASAVMDVVAKAAPGIRRAWYDPRERSPVVEYASGQVAPWKELSDGFHVYLALVADLARRAVILNEVVDGGEAPAKVEGVVLLDEIDLHLHPRWQRNALPALRKVFPRLQFVVTTHSPQVLSSVENHQVRRLVDGRLDPAPVRVEGRDTNAILRDYMATADRDERGRQRLEALHRAIDDGDLDGARAMLDALKADWPAHDPAIIRAETLVDDAVAGAVDEVTEAPAERDD
jgi:predicted ATP-binding protein involved in virulence